MLKRFYFLLLVVCLGIFSYRFYVLRFVNHDSYFDTYVALKYKTVTTESPRGRILDRNGKVLVDNVGSKAIYYRFIDNGSLEEAVLFLSNVLEDISLSTKEEEIEYYMIKNNTDGLLSDEEKELIKKRELSNEDAMALKRTRVEEKLEYSEDDKKKIHLYFLLSDGYIFDNKMIKDKVSDKECALVSEANLPGLFCASQAKRVYLYDTMNALYGSVGAIPFERKEEYLHKGYSLNDTVGLSYLEKEYDEYLRGEDSVYMVKDDGSLELVQKGRCGDDLVLTIDIDLQLKINEIIKKNLVLAKSLKNTDYYNSSYVLVSNPNTGEIIASTGLSYSHDSFRDISTNLLTQSFTVGSVIKGASHTVGYQNNLIEVGKKINDSCVKLYQNPVKCSYKRLGLIDDITALKTSSNYYQFINAIKLTGNTYKNNMKLVVSQDHFDTYRKTFEYFGLGKSTGIDVENESMGIRGDTIAGDLLLNLSIGQYDTYTSFQLLNYINTIATSGIRYSLHYLKNVQNDDNILYSYEPRVLSRIEDNWFFSRIIEGFKEVLYNGTGRGYTDVKYKPAGKTGTSEVVYSKGVTTINQTYAMFAPYDAPKYSIVVISPNISYNNDRDNYIAPINRYIAKEVSALVFDSLE